MNIRVGMGTVGVLDFGRTGENLARTLYWNCSSILAEWPDAAFHLLIQRPNDSAPYIAATKMVDSDLVLAVTSAETEQAGKGKLELQALQNEAIVKTATVCFSVAASLDSEAAADSVPAPVENWVTEVLQSADSAAQYAEEASASADKAEDAIKRTPTVSESGTWLVWSTTTETYIDTGICAAGQKGERGEKGETGATGATGPQGPKGDSDLPAVTDSDTGKVLMVVDGEWKAVALQNGDEVSY